MLETQHYNYFSFVFFFCVFQRPDISAGALLSKTHEELILLLIQLRRQHHAREHAMEKGYREIQLIQVKRHEKNKFINFIVFG